MYLDTKPRMKYELPIFYTLSFLICLPIPIIAQFGSINIAISYASMSLLLFFLNYFNQKPVYFLIGSLFIGFMLYGSLRIQLVNLAAYFYAFHFYLNKNTDYFNQNKLPGSIKLTSFILISAVFLSSINSKYFSGISLYFGFLFFTFIFTGYLIFRSARSTKDVEKFLLLFVIFTSINAIFFIIPQIIITQKLRSTGISSMAFMDFTGIASIIMIFGYFLVSKNNRLHNLLMVTSLVVLITSLSRFAWLAFITSFIYGIFIAYKYSEESRIYLAKKINILIITIFFFIIFSLATGVANLVFSRVLEIKFEFFTNVNLEEGEMISNTLESRIIIWITAFSAFISHPATGVGYFMFHRVSENYNVLPVFIYDALVKGLDAHSVFMNLLSETGIIGVISFYTFIINANVLSLKAIKLSKTADERRISIALAVIMFYYASSSIYSGAYTFGQNAFQFYMTVGIAIINYVLIKKKYELSKSEQK